MPAKSKNQFKFMQGIAHGMKPYSGKGPSKAVAEDFVAATPKDSVKKLPKLKLQKAKLPHAPRLKFGK